MNALIIISRDLEKGSTKYRIAQYAHFLKENGINLEFCNKKEINTSLLKKLDQFDVIFNQKCLININLSKKILSKKRKIIFDFDDAIYTRPGKPHSFFTDLRVKRRLHFWLQNADIVTAANQYLANTAQQYSRFVSVIPMAIDMDMWSPADKKDKGEVIIGWAGAPVNIHNIERLEPVLSHLLRKYSFLRLAIFSGEKPRLDCPFEHHPYSPGAEPSFVRNLDVGLLPLIEEEFTRGKSPIKAIQYLSCGVPVVGNVTGATSEILNNQNSFTVSSDAEWIKALEAMILDGNLRSSLGVAGRSFVLKHHNMETVKGQMLQLFLESPTP